MRVYFLSDVPCMFFVNGLPLGRVDAFARSVELSPTDGVFCECKAEGCIPVRFRFDGELLFSPPEGVEVYLIGECTAVRLRTFLRADPSPRIAWQRHIAGQLLTLRVQGSVVLNAEGIHGLTQTVLPFAFEACVPSAAGEDVLLEGAQMFALIGADGALRLLSDGRVTEREGARITAEVPFRDVLGHVARCTYERGRLTGYTLLSARAPSETTVALALFESVLAGFDPLPYLAPALAEKAEMLRAYLGTFTAAVPLGVADRIGLVTPRRPRVFEVRPFRVTLEDGKVSNIFPA